MTVNYNSSLSQTGSTGQKDSGGFDRFRKFLSAQAGISLADNKHYLVESRLKNILTENGLPHIDDLLRFIETHPGTPLVDKVVDAMTTNETFWFRDTYFYDYLESILIPHLLKTTPVSQSIDIWSAASSSGQEAYSFSMVVEQCLNGFRLQGQKTSTVNIFGTDISRQMIDYASSATYSQLELSRGLPDAIFKQYFDKLPDGKAKVKETVRSRTRFKLHNLMERFDSFGRFDVVMCRNVLIYFDEKTIESILRRIHTTLKKNGVLFLSSSENVRGLDDIYKAETTPAGIMYRAIK